MNTKSYLKPLPSACFPSPSSVSSSHLPHLSRTIHLPLLPVTSEETNINIIFVQQQNVCIPPPHLPALLPFFLFPSFCPPPIVFQRSADHRRRKRGQGQHNEDDDCLPRKSIFNPQQKFKWTFPVSARPRSPSPPGRWKVKAYLFKSLTPSSPPVPRLRPVGRRTGKVYQFKSIIKIQVDFSPSPLLPRTPPPARGSDAGGCKVSAAFAAPLTACIKHAHIRPQLLLHR
ncbi:hypothetical protein niasHT_008839 [Heterodera trifolii]|uniref:Uncharacterized protein n=1 Tax=Heterodera trifolii TaxID=157864 RepID=A0ABD2M826_9BILA